MEFFIPVSGGRDERYGRSGGTMNEELKRAMEIEEGKTQEDFKQMEPVDIAVLKTINQQKQEMYAQMGMLMEAVFQLQGQMAEVDRRKQQNAAEMQKKYNLLDGHLWRVDDQGRILSVANPQR